MKGGKAPKNIFIPVLFKHKHDIKPGVSVAWALAKE